MKKLLILSALPLITVLGLHQISLASTWDDCISGNKKVKTENRNVANFTRISVGGAYEVMITKSASHALVIEADENLLPYIITEVENGVLIIRNKENICNAKSQIIRVSMPNLEGIKASGASEVESSDQFESEKFDLEASGASEIELNIKAKLVVSKLSGASELELVGAADTHALEMNGASELEADEFVVKKYAIESSGASECSVQVTEELNVTASGASEVKYKGKPAKISKKLSGSSELSGK